MAKAVFRPGELTQLNEKVLLQSPENFELAHLFPPSGAESQDDRLSEEEVYTGPTVEDIRREAEDFRVHWEIEKETMISASRAEAGRIVREAGEKAARELARKTAEGDEKKRLAEEDAALITAEAEKKASEIEADALAEFERKRQEAENAGREAGREEGYAEGKAEVDRLIERVQAILERAQNLRSEILADTEQQIIDLALLISRKVIKTISESQKTVVLQNIAQALKKVRARGTILIRVNIADLKLTTEHSKTFIQMMEGAKDVQIVEDSSVDPGGCIIETDFGEVDARISSQLAELEAKILELSPIKGKPKPASPPAPPSSGGN
ncbi:MAG: flagellar assembly protein FliH [Spirochaetaceae bacterium]|jgi:flagellar assembly protein FliH|nr:flagellar assembly protein FliH [Spirochaetaceae bacterium]